jgi:hypothetical protein
MLVREKIDRTNNQADELRADGFHQTARPLLTKLPNCAPNRASRRRSRRPILRSGPTRSQPQEITSCPRRGVKGSDRRCSRCYRSLRPPALAGMLPVARLCRPTTPMSMPTRSESQPTFPASSMTWASATTSNSRYGSTFRKSGEETVSRSIFYLRSDKFIGERGGRAALRQNEQACPTDASRREVSARRRTRRPGPPRHAGRLQEDRAWPDKPAEDRFPRWRTL